MGRYTAAHADPQGAGDARPTALQIIQDEDLVDQLQGKVIVITGATSGIGWETVRALSATGATLFLTARNLDGANHVLGDLLKSGRAIIVEMDQTSLQSVREAAKVILAKSNHQVNILIANAGIMGIPNLQLTKDGHETTFQTNHLSHFLLFELLRPALLASVRPDFNSRFVMIASSAARVKRLPTSDDYSFQKSAYNHEHAYAHSKLAQVYATNKIDRLYGAQGLHATSVHPGGIATNISRHLAPEALQQILENPYVAKYIKSAQQGAATTIVAAVGKEWEGKGGKYLEDTEEAARGEEDGSAFGVGYVPHMYEEDEEERLYQNSLKMIQV